MAVVFTSNIALAKPDEAELASNWARNAQLQAYNNNILVDKTDINLVSYTPVLAAATTPPSIGAGLVKGEYQDIQGFIQGDFLIEFTDPGVTVGSGEYGISLPAVVDNAFHTVSGTFSSAVATGSCIGEGYIFDNSNVSLSGPVALDVVTTGGVSYARLIPGTFAAPVKTSRVFRDSMPSALGNGDKWTGSFFYKKL